MNRDELLDKLAMELEKWPEFKNGEIPTPNAPGIWGTHHMQWECFARGDETPIHKQDYLDRREQLINCPPDSDAPSWAKWMAQDGDGCWLWLEIKPYGTDSSIWMLKGEGYIELASVGKIPAGHDWKQTLREVNCMTTTAHEDQFTPNAPVWPDKKPTPSRDEMIKRLNCGLAYWPSDVDEAQEIMPVEHPWQWKKGDLVFLVDHRALWPVTRDDWNTTLREVKRDGVCSDGTQCGTFAETAYCDDCPSAAQQHIVDSQRLDAQLSEAISQSRVSHQEEDAEFDRIMEQQCAADPASHYHHSYKGVKIDPYRIAKIYAMNGGPREQIMKKCLRFTEKGQTEQQVVNEIRSALNRWQEMLDEDAH